MTGTTQRCWSGAHAGTRCLLADGHDGRHESAEDRSEHATRPAAVDAAMRERGYGEYADQVRRHPPVNGCTIVGEHVCWSTRIIPELAGRPR